MVFGRYINVNSGKAKKGEEILTFYQKRFKVQGSGFRVQGSGFKVQGSRCWVQGAGFKVRGEK